MNHVPQERSCYNTAGEEEGSTHKPAKAPHKKCFLGDRHLYKLRYGL
jgi:hypothetical protein